MSIFFQWYTTDDHTYEDDDDSFNNVFSGFFKNIITDTSQQMQSMKALVVNIIAHIMVLFRYSVTNTSRQTNSHRQALKL